MAYPEYNQPRTPFSPGSNSDCYTLRPGHNSAQLEPYLAQNHTDPQPYVQNGPSHPLSQKHTTKQQVFELEDFSTFESDNEGRNMIPQFHKQTFHQKYLSGLKRTLRLFVLLATLILVGNLTWLLYGRTRYGITKAADGHRYGTVQTGSCAAARRTNTWLHLAINIMSTLLLTGSNAFMAAYSGPTRQEVDEAHRKRKWLHVGSMSLRNMTGIAKKKSFVVLILLFSSVPFHLLYNSLIFTSLATNDYYWAIVTETFIGGASYNLTGPPKYFHNSDGTSETVFSISNRVDLPDGSYIRGQAEIDKLYEYFDIIQTTASKWERLDQEECIQAYSNVVLPSRRNVVLVTSTKNDSNSMINYGSAVFKGGLDANFWLCSERYQDGGQSKCVPEQLSANASSWKVFGNPVEYCLSERVDDICSVKFSLDIMIIVIVFNLMKLLAMSWILLRLDAAQILACVGDATASFIHRPDPNTWGMCLANARNVDDFWKTPGIARLYDGVSHRHWGQAVSRRRWTVFFLLVFAAFCTVFFFGWWGFAHLHSQGVSLSLGSLWSLGFGIVNQYTMAIYGGSGNAITMSVVANLPQVILAFIYLLYQGIINSMFTAADWAQFAFTAQNLMVSTPIGDQRGIWLLGAPLLYGIPVLTLQTLLHWFVSQSIFVVQLTKYNSLGTLYEEYDTYSNCGYSPIAIIFSVVACGLLCVTAIILKWRKIPLGAPPVVSTCSAAISAACHVPADVKNDFLRYQKLRWGVTNDPLSGIGHCSLGPAKEFDIGHAGPPVSGWAYAGMDKVD